MIPKLFIRRREKGDHGWAVFAQGNKRPINVGLTRAEARARKTELEAMYRSRGQGTTL